MTQKKPTQKKPARKKSAQKKADVEAELAELRARVQALSEAQAGRTVTARSDEADESRDATGAEGLPDFDELFDLLKHEVEDLHPMTALAIFGLGVLTGRLLAQ